MNLTKNKSLPPIIIDNVISTIYLVSFIVHFIDYTVEGIRLVEELRRLEC